MSACGDSAMWMPTARYSSRAIVANRSTNSALPIAASPVVSGHCEKPFAQELAPVTC